MGTTVDSLDIQLQMQSQRAITSIDTLISRLGRLNSSLATVNSRGFATMGSGINKLANSTSNFSKNTKNADFSRLARNIKTLNSIDTSQISKLSGALKTLSGGLSSISGVTFNASGLNEITSALRKLGGIKGTSGTENLSKISNNLGQFVRQMNEIGSLTFNVDNLSMLISSISKLGSKSSNNATKNLPTISAQIQNFVRQLNKIGSLSFDTKNLSDLITSISRFGYTSSKKAIDNIPKIEVAMKNLITTLSKAPRVSQNLIDMTNALANLARTGASSGKAATSLSRSLDTYTKSTSKASSGTKGLASALGKMYASYWLLFRAFQKIGQSITLASDLVEVQNVVNTVFGDMTAKVEQYADRSIEQFGMSELALKQYASRFQAMGSAMGIDSGIIGQANSFLNKSTNGYVALSDSMADVSLTLTQLTADMASFYNVEQSAVAEDLAAIFTGETRPLRTYGLDLTQATLAEWAMKQGLDANIRSMSQAEKTMLRYQYVLANTTAAQGDFARTANTWANQLRILQEQLKKWASVIGTGFIAAFKPFLQTLNTVMAKVIDFTENVLNALGNIFGWKFEITGGGITDDLADSMGDTAIDTGDAAGSAGDLSDNLGDAAKNAKKLYSTVLGIDELNINNPNTGSAGSGSGGSGGTGGSGSGGAGAGTGSGLTTTISRNDAILEAYESSIDSLYKLGEYIGNTLTKTLNSINWDRVYQGARNFGKGLADFLNGLISPDLFGAVGRTIAGALNTAIYAALSFGETFDFYDFGVSIATGINEFFRTFDFGALAQTLNVWVNGIEEAIIAALSHINWGNIFKSIYDFISNLEFDTAILVGWYALPKLFKSITSNKFVKGFTTLSKALAGNQTALLALTQSYPKLSKAVNVARKAFQNFQFGVINGNIMTGLNEGILTVRNSLTKMQKGVIGAISVFAEFSLVKDAFYDLAMGSDNLVISLGKIAVGAGAAAAALKLMGLSNPFTAVITGATALLAAIIGVNSAMTEQKQIAEEQEQMKMYGDTLDNITQKTNELADGIKRRAEEAQKYVETAGVGEMAMASDLADRYFNLAEKESLTNTEKEEMQRLAQSLVEQLPELENYYNTQTGLLDTNREALQKMIDERLREIQLSAIEDKLKEAYQDQAEALFSLNESAERVNDTQEKMNGLLENQASAWQDVQDLQAYNLLSEQIKNATGNTESLKEQQDALWDKLTNNGETEFPSMDALLQKYSDATTALQDYEDDYNEVMADFGTNQEAYNTATESITKLSDMLGQGMVSAAEDGVAGFTETFNVDTTMQSAAMQQALDTYNAFREGLDEHSPSKKFAQSGSNSISGYILGVNTSAPIAIAAMQVLAAKIANSFGEGLTNSIKKVAQNIPTYFSTAWTGISTIFSVAPQYFSTVFTSSYNMIKVAFQSMDAMFHKEWDDTKAVFKDVTSFFRNGFTSAYRAITSAFSGLSSFFRGVANDIIDPIGDAINGVIKGMNWILDEVGSSKNISLWSAPNFATGSNGIPQDTLGVVNDQPGSTYKELIVPPSGKPFIPEGRNVMLPLEKGTKIMPAKQTKVFMSGMPHFAKGIGDFFGSAWKSYSSYTGDILDYMNKPKELLQIATDKYTNISGWKSSVGTMAAYTAKTIVDNAVSYISKIMDEMLTVKYNPSAGVEQWRNLAAKALQMTGQYSASNLNLLLYQMQTESGGNPNAINNWDINAKNGTPSKGLMQVIDPTFKAYAMKGYNTNIYDPLSNMIAAIRYTVSRYGSLANGWKGHGYASGIGKINLSDLIPAYEVGGFPEDGLFFANHNELVGRFDNGRTVVANNTNIQSGIKEGVKEAVAEILAPYLQQIAQNTRETADKDFAVDVDGRSLVSAYDRRKSRNGFSFT